MPGIHLTDRQRRVADHVGSCRVLGAAGTGKTTALVHRYLRLARRSGAAGVLVLARDRAAAESFRQAVLPGLQGGFDTLAVTTAWGLAFDLVARHDGPVHLLSGAEQRAVVRRLLAAEGGDGRRWPLLHPLVGRRGFADEVAAALQQAHARLLDAPAVAAAAAAAGDRRWEELARFFGRYEAALAGPAWLDGGGVLARACRLLADHGRTGGAGAAAARFGHVLVDDYETATPGTARLVSLLADDGADVTVAGNPELAVGSAQASSPVHLERFTGASLDLVLDRPFRDPAPAELVRSNHPSVEPEAVAGELLAARRRGAPWDAMAVLARDPGRRRAVVRALARNGVPVAAAAGAVHDHPVVRGLIELLRWAGGEAVALDRLLGSAVSGLDPATLRRVRRAARAGGGVPEEQPELARLVAVRDELARRAGDHDVASLGHLAFRLTLADLVRGPEADPGATEDRALDAVTAFLDGLDRHVARHPATGLGDFLDVLDDAESLPDPWAAAPPAAGAVTVAPLGAAGGRQWDTVVVAGCVEGELPRVGGRPRFFDAAVLDGGPLPSAPERRRRSLAEERRLFALACSRATGSLVLTAAPEPGVLLSRFVEHLTPRPARFPFAGPPPRPAPSLRPTPGVAPLHPDGAVRLSASSLATYEDCPLRHAYAYVLGVRDEGGVHARLGTLVHEVLQRFLDPHGGVAPHERSRERLHQLAESCWSDDLAPFRPQLEQARRELFDMLDRWWENEGGPAGRAPAVLATERPFDVAVGDHRVSGRIDRIDRVEDGLRVVDYKSGRRLPRREEVADDVQLATYHLAVGRDPEVAAWGPPVQLRLLHLRTMRAFDQDIGPRHGERTEARILATAGRILAEELEPSVEADCDHCDVHRLCPLWPEGREVGDP